MKEISSDELVGSGNTEWGARGIKRENPLETSDLGLDKDTSEMVSQNPVKRQCSDRFANILSTSRAHGRRCHGPYCRQLRNREQA